MDYAAFKQQLKAERAKSTEIEAKFMAHRQTALEIIDWMDDGDAALADMLIRAVDALPPA